MRKYLVGVCIVLVLVVVSLSQTVNKIRFDSTSPAAPAGNTNIHFQTNTSVNPPLISAYVPTAVLVATGTQPTCSSSYPGWLWYTTGGTGVKDKLELCAMDATGTWAWRAIY